MEELANHPSLESLEFHWLTQGVLNQVRDQGPCNCCWVITCADSSAALRKIQVPHEDLSELAIQEMIDCTKNKYPHYKYPKEDKVRCFASKLSIGFEFLKDHGLCEEAVYPFIKQRGDRCRSGEIQSRRLRITSFDRLDKGDVTSVCNAIRGQPLVGSIRVHIKDVNIRDLQGDIYRHPAITCGPETLEESRSEKKWFYHAVLLVGFGQEQGLHYYLVKNSWGTSWGINGFGKIACDKLCFIKHPVGPVNWSDAP